MSTKSMFSGAVALGVFALVAGSTLARAADLDTPYVGSQQFPDDKVEFGSGWYIRGDMGVTHNQKIGISDVPSFQTNVYDSSGAIVTDSAGIARYNGSVNPQAPSLGLSTSSNLGYTASLGGGYKFNNWLRGDVVADFHQPLSSNQVGKSHECLIGYSPIKNAAGVVTDESKITTSCTPQTTGRLDSYSILANAYVDLGTWYNVTPYVGAGAGLSFGHYQASSKWTQPDNSSYDLTFADQVSTTINYHVNWDRHASGMYYNFAWAAMAGVAIDVYDHTKLDIGYRYLNLGKINGLTGTLTSQEVHAGVRYMIDD